MCHCKDTIISGNAGRWRYHDYYSDGIERKIIRKRAISGSVREYLIQITKFPILLLMRILFSKNSSGSCHIMFNVNVQKNRRGVNMIGRCQGKIGMSCGS